MRRSFVHASLAFALSGALLSACAPKATTVRPESERNVVTAADIEKTPDTPLELIIQRVVPGVIVNTVDGTMVIHLRGMTNAIGDLRPPLFILNGLRTAPSASGEMPQVDPKDVQTIKVLKGTDAAIYGLDGANGVIVITTKGH